MKISEARASYNLYAKKLSDNKKSLIKKRDEAKKNAEKTGDSKYLDDAATLELSIKELEEKSEDNQKVIDSIFLQWNLQFEAQQQKNSSENAKKTSAEVAKIMEVARRISSGAIVPASDEKKLMEYNDKLYYAAKQAQMFHKMNDKKREKYKSLWEDDENKKAQDNPDPAEMADNTEISIEAPDMQELDIDNDNNNT